MIFYWSITTASPHYLVICNQGGVTHMQPQRCLPCAHQLFVELHRKNRLTSQKKSLMQWKRWIINCKIWNLSLFLSPKPCGILKILLVYHFVIAPSATTRNHQWNRMQAPQTQLLPLPSCTSSGSTSSCTSVSFLLPSSTETSMSSPQIQPPSLVCFRESWLLSSNQ